ncbi:MAG: Txe/YoeB family addiction module toxin [Noviherbaspirillum sp.]
MVDRTLKFTNTAWEDYLCWQGQDKKTLRRINDLLQATLRAPFEGMGKPEPLCGNLSGLWSRRIDQEHRLVYEVTQGAMSIVACRYHYSNHEAQAIKSRPGCPVR